MSVVRQSFTNVLGPHDKNRRAVGKAPLFIVALAIESRGISELAACLRNDLTPGAVTKRLSKRRGGAAKLVSAF